MAFAEPVVNSHDSSHTTSQHEEDIEEYEQEYFFDKTVEFPEDYGPGKLHPVHLGDVFKAARYKVFRKLGAGSFSTVWLARDVRLTNYVALKIATAHSSATEHESTILEYLSRHKLQHPGQRHVTMLLDSFEHHGPNGLHRCLVFDVMGPISSDMFDHLPPGLDPPEKCGEPSENRKGRLPFWMAKSIIKQTLLGIDFLHKNGIVHGDLQPGNILYSVKNISSLPESELAQADSPGDSFATEANSNGEVNFEHLVARANDPKPDAFQNDCKGKPDLSTPRYILPKEPLFKYVDLDPPLLIKISDLGGAFFISEPPAKPATPIALRSPELVLGQPISEAQDIWSFGCLMFEFLTGKPLCSARHL